MDTKGISITCTNTFVVLAMAMVVAKVMTSMIVNVGWYCCDGDDNDHLVVVVVLMMIIYVVSGYGINCGVVEMMKRRMRMSRMRWWRMTTMTIIRMIVTDHDTVPE